jgi:hypothetical protein
MENCRGQGHWCLCSTRLAYSRLVPRGHGDVHREASTASTETEKADITNLAREKTPPVQELANSSVSIIRTKLERYNISTTAKDVIMASWYQKTILHISY